MNKPKFGIGDKVYISFYHELEERTISGVFYNEKEHYFEYNFKNSVISREEDFIYTSKEDFISKIKVV